MSISFHFRMHPVLLALLSTYLLSQSSACDYQRVDPSHTMCVYNPRSCGGKTLIRKYRIWRLSLKIVVNSHSFVAFYEGASGMSCHDKQVILETHNRLRQMLALGQIRGQPPSLDMRELVRSLYCSPTTTKKYITKETSFLAFVRNLFNLLIFSGMGWRTGCYSATMGRSMQRWTWSSQKNRY